jgi:hypothetical protein
MLQHELNKFQRVQSHTVETAVAYFAIGKQSVLFVQKYGPYFLIGTEPEPFDAKVEDVVNVEALLLLYGALGGTGNDFPDESAGRIDRLSTAIHKLAFGIRSGEKVADAPETSKYPFGKELIVAPQIDIAEQKFKDLVVGKSGRILEKTLPQAGAMPGTKLGI